MNRKRIFVIISMIVLFLQVSLAQDAIFDSSAIPTAEGAILRSAILPGFGQLYQERLSQSAFFYFSTFALYGSSIYYIDLYNKDGKRGDYSAFQTSLSAAVFVHLLNILDATDAALRENPLGWQADLLSDRPLKSPSGAAMRSAIIPGWGQVYVENYYRAAGAVLINGYLLYLVIDYNNKYKETRKRSYLEQRSKYSWYLGAAYLLTLADAMAGAYLYKFDEAMRLSLLPRFERENYALHFTVQLRF